MIIASDMTAVSDPKGHSRRRVWILRIDECRVTYSTMDEFPDIEARSLAAIRPRSSMRHIPVDFESQLSD